MAVTSLPVPGDDPGDEVWEIDPNTLTLGELEEIEEISGRPVSLELGRGTPSIRTLIGIVYVMKRRSDPSYTLDDARALQISTVKLEAKQGPKAPGG